MVYFEFSKLKSLENIQKGLQHDSYCQCDTCHSLSYRTQSFPLKYIELLDKPISADDLSRMGLLREHACRHGMLPVSVF
uniref:Uncharacterized protein n=1 Tax=Amphimedon queenslandica TaxID=400682 RepID=A0A1X7TW69_AMPQE